MNKNKSTYTTSSAVPGLLGIFCNFVALVQAHNHIMNNRHGSV